MKLIWKPTKPQRKFKAKAYREHPKEDFSKLSDKEIQIKTGSQTVLKWLQDDQFREWFLDKDFTRQMFQVGSELAVQRLIDIVECDDVGPRGEVTAAAQVNAAKILLEMGDFAPNKKKTVIFKDQDIENMDEQELREYAKQRLRLINGETD